MTKERCEEMQLLLQADLDRELDVGGTALLAAHLTQCPDCAARQTEMAGLSARLRADLPYHAAPARLRAAIEAAVASSGARTPLAPAATRRPWFRFGGTWPDRALSFGVGVAAAAALAVVVVPPRGEDMAGSVLASHLRALQPGHLTDVASTDRHTVKPWFAGRLDYAPPVKDLAAEGYPLTGGRLDYLAGRPVAALAYRHDRHVIDLYVWPLPGAAGAPPRSGARNGYNSVQWREGEMAFWAVSDLNKTELDNFVARWRAMP